MYGIVLMAALSGNADMRVPEDAGNSLYHQTHEYRFRRGRGCCGGCYGGGCYGGGCCGGCSGGGCYGGCHGGYRTSGYGCCGGTTYSGYTPAPQGYRNSYYGPQPLPSEAPVRLAPLQSDRAGDLNDNSQVQPRTAPAPRETGQSPEARLRPNSLDDRRQFAAPSQALLVVRVPEPAKVFIDGQPTESTGGTRTYVSPPLPAGEFHYMVRAEIVQQGRKITTGKEVTVRAGQSSEVTLDMSAFAPMPRQ